jgi:hypothetical protein
MQNLAEFLEILNSFLIFSTYTVKMQRAAKPIIPVLKKDSFNLVINCNKLKNNRNKLKIDLFCKIVLLNLKLNDFFLVFEINSIEISTID